MDSRKQIIIPDVHGRKFWREAVKGIDGDTHVVFLGDYLDPYEDDGIDWSDAFKSLQDIIDFKKSHPEQVTLLLGNHDLHYLYPSLKGSRYNVYQASKIKRTLADDIDCFQMAAECTLGGTRYFFSHAGVHSDWVERHSNQFGPLDKVSADTFNRLMFTEDFVEALADISWRRGGSSPVGSMVWADIYEYGLSRPIAADVVQICGHTRLPEGKPKEMEHIWCLDCQRAFILTADGIR
jgi:hypothetical protein